MTTYNTQNPIGSTDPRDLYDNAENFDECVNSTALTFDDRFGNARKTIAGAVAAIGYDLTLGDYGAGKVFTERNQVVLYSGEYYKVKASVALPFTTTGTWGTDEASLVGVGDAVLRQDLLEDDGASRVGFKLNATGAVETDIDTVLQDFVSVKRFGAVGDGVADDYAAIMAAHDALPATGGEIRCPRGSYLHNARLVFTKRVRLVGEGASAVNNTSASEFVKGAGVAGTGLELLGMGSAIIAMGFRGLPGNTGDGLHIREGRVTLEDVMVSAMGRDGVRIGNDSGPSNCNLWCVRNLRSKNNGRHGLHISDKVRPTLPDANGGTLTHADLQANGECGLCLGNNALNTYIGVVCQVNGTYGVFSSASSKDNSFYGGDFEVNGRVGGASVTSFADFFIEAGSIANRIFGITCFNFPVSFVNNEPDNVIIGALDGSFAGQNKYAGINLRNISSSVPTVLDWYQEGTFTPVLEGTTSAGVGTYTTQLGFYTRIGNKVTFHLNIGWSAHTGTGNMLIVGLPFASTNTTFQPVEIVPSNMTTPAGAIVKAMVIANSQNINIYSILTGGVTTFAALAMDTSASCWVSGVYEVA